MAQAFESGQGRIVALRRFLFGDRRASKLALALVSLDLVFVVVHGVKYAFKEETIELFGYWLYRNLTITNDWAIPEVTNYLKFVVIVFLLIRTFALVRQPVYLAWAFVYAVALMDDSLQIHEGLGAVISAWLGDVTLFGAELQADSGFRVQDLGELIVYGLYGVTFAGVLALGFLWSGTRHRVIGLGFGLLLGGLAFFVAAVDMVDRLVAAHSGTLAGVLATLEDGGEMIVISLTVAFALIVYRSEAARLRDQPVF